MIDESDGSFTTKPTIRLAGTVQKLIPAIGTDPEKAEIALNGADDYTGKSA